MRILFLIDSLGSGGAQRQMTTIAPIMKYRGIDVEVLCYHKDAFFQYPLNQADIKVHWLLQDNPIMRLIKIRSFVRKGNYDAVISFLDTPDFINCFAAIGRHKWKIITSERSAKEEKFHTMRGKLIGKVKSLSDYIICNSENAKTLWLKYYPHYQEKLKVIYNVCSVQCDMDNCIVRSNGKLHILVAASYQYVKNPLGVIEALHLLPFSVRCKIDIQWYGRYSSVTDEATCLSKQYNVDDSIAFHGETSDVIEKMKNADVVMLVSKLEGLPNAICEGMMLGKPIIMSKVSDYEKFVDESNGFLVNWDSPQSIADALTAVSELSEEEIFTLGKNSKIKAQTLFSASSIIPQWLSLFS